ncbi:hypothetical protein niasHS_009530 [Heterodera schachtii]|uniref:Uncharacterized protein n=1 Tax=Heterodera schachtii TaxID=97005 RepID=A0ABD2JC94_HETSC
MPFVHQQFKQISRIFFAINIWWPWRWANRHMTNRRVNCTNNVKANEVQRFFNEHTEAEFEKAGAVASADISLLTGLLPAELHLHGAMEPQLRKGIWDEFLIKNGPTAKILNKCAIELLEEFTVCKTGDLLSADQASILKQFGHRLAQFHVRLFASVEQNEGI